MKPKLYTYETTYECEDAEGAIISSMEVRIHYTWIPMVPARIHWDENDHPMEPDEIEIQRITKEVPGFHSAKATRFVDTSSDEFLTVEAFAETNLREALIESASEEEECAEEAAQEHAYETRRDLERMEEK